MRRESPLDGPWPLVLAGLVSVGVLSACGADDAEPSNGPAAAGGAPGAGGETGSAPDADAPSPGTGCNGLSIPATSDYSADGPYGRAMVENTGPDGQYTLFLPATPGMGGIKHPIATWGNGITTNPSMYVELLGAIASHGFVIVASNSSTVTPALMTTGLEWLISQNEVPGNLQGILETDCAATIGYSLGGAGALGAGSHPNVKATVTWHGLTGPSEALSGPLLVITATVDGFVTKAANAQPQFDRSSVQPTFLATLDFPGEPVNFAGHTIPLQNGAGPERAPAVAWLRYWIYGDEGARPWFFGPECQLCTTPWIDVQRKNHDW